MPPARVLMSIILIVIVMIAAYYVTYYIGTKATGQSRPGLRMRTTKLLDRFAISRDKSFVVIEIADKVYVVAVSNNAMTLLNTYDAEEFAELIESKSQDNPAWNMTPVGQYGNKLTQRVVAFVAEKTGKKPPEADEPESGNFSDNMKIANEQLNSAQNDDTEED